MIVTTSNLVEVAAYLRGYVYRAADTETYGLSYSDSLFSIILAAGDRAFYFNFKDYEDGSPLLPRDSFVIDILQGIFSDNCTWFFHNAKFDKHKLRKFGIEVGGTAWDTKVHARILQNNLLDYSLAALTKTQVHTKSKEVDDYIKKHKLWTTRQVAGKKKIVKDLHFDKVPFSLISDYGLKDGRCTLELGMSQVEKYSTMPELHALRDTENALLNEVFEMESRGMQIDSKYVMEAWEAEKRLILEAEQEFFKLASVPYKDIAKKELVKLLEAAGEEIKLSDKGNSVLDSDALDEMTSPIANIIKTIRYHEKRITSFYSSFIEYRDQDNVIHANIDQAGTETGRFSMSSPNLQQLSKDGDENERYSIRRCFTPRSGRIFVQWDYSQQEYRLMADYANERGLIDKILDGFDVHQATAELVGVSRQEAKTVNFAVLYGSGPKKLAAMLGISVLAAKRLIDRYFAALPMVENFISRVIGTGRSRGFIFNWVGRRCHIANREWAYILPNHLIQGSGADVMKRAVVAVGKLLREVGAVSNMCLTVHDSLVLEMVESEFHLIPRITEILETTYTAKNDIILKTDIEWSAVSLAKKDMHKGAPSGRVA